MKRVKRFVSLLLVLCLVLGTVSETAFAAEIASGTCGGEGDGTNLRWTLTDDGTLTISGSGKMKDWTYWTMGGIATTPWNYYRKFITNVSIELGVTSIGGRAFNNFSSLKAITIPASVTYIGEDAFDQANYLERVYICDLSAWCETQFVNAKSSPQSSLYVDGVLVEDMVIPSGTRRINGYAFYWCEDLKSVFVPGTVTEIGEYVFGNCRDLIECTLSDGIKSLGTGVFYQDYNLKTCNLPKTLSDMGAGVFYECKSLEGYIEIPSAIREIKKSTFYDCEALRAVTFSPELSVIAEYAFFGCESLEEISDMHAVTAIGYSAFMACRALKAVKLGEKLTIIGERAFQGCESLSEITIPGSVISVGASAFWECENLSEVKILDGVQSIGRCAFLVCEKLASVKLPDSIQSIGDSAFCGCGIKEINIPRKIATIEEGTFESCYYLTSITIPETVTSIGDGVFRWCGSLTSVYFMGDAPDTGRDWLNSVKNLPDGFALYYIPGTSGWTDSADYDAIAGTWKGYPLKTWMPDLRRITQLTEDGVTVNGRGYASGVFQVTDAAGTPVSGARITYSIGEWNSDCVTDGRGIFTAETPEVYVSQCFPVKFTMPDYSGDVIGAEQEIDVTVSPLSYSQKWNLSLGAEAKGSLGAGAGVTIPKAKLEATALELSLKGGASGEIELEDSYEGGERTLELTYTHGLSGSGGFKSGVEATVPSTKIELAKAAGNVILAGQESTGLKIENYDPKDMAAALDVGLFMLQTAITGSQSLWAAGLLDWLDVGGHNQSAHTVKLAMNSGTSVGVFETGFEDELTLGGLSGALIATTSQSNDYLGNTKSSTASFTVESGVSLLEGLVDGTKSWAGDKSNEQKVSAKYDSNNALTELSYSWCDGDTAGICWTESTEETSTKWTYKGTEAAHFAAATPELEAFTAGKKRLLALWDFWNIGDAIAEGDYRGETKCEHTIKNGVTVDIPVELKCIIGAKVALEGAGARELSYTTETDIAIGVDQYLTSYSTVSPEEVLQQQKALDEILTEAFDAVVEEAKGFFSAVGNAVAEGVENGWAAVKGAVGDAWVQIKRVPSLFSLQGESYAILAVADENLPDSAAGVSVTLGEPYAVNVYTDESCETPLSDEELEASPLTLTLKYDQTMLNAARVTGDAPVKIYYFDVDRNAYICLQDSVQDKAAMSVTAQITRQGEYILATDSASPLISDCAASDRTPTPTLTAYVGDLSGIGAFRFWVDDGNELVDTGSFEQHYAPQSGTFTYAFTKALSSGEHTAYFQAEDTLGNANAEPFVFTFTVDGEAPEIDAVTLPTEPVTDAAGFRVTAEIADNEAVASAWLTAETAEKTLSAPMALDEATGLWCADVGGIAGLTEMEITVFAADDAGNRSEAAAGTVTIAVPAAPAGVETGIVRSEGGEICAAVINHEATAVSGWLVCAVYAENGQMLALDEVCIGLLGGERAEFSFRPDCDSSRIHEIRCFLIDIAEDYTPVE